MRTTKLMMLCLCCLIAAPAVLGQAASSAAKPGILGYLDPQTGAFRPVAPAEDVAEAPALTTFTGTINVVITVTLKTTGLTNVVCNIATSVQDGITSGSPRFYSESNSVVASGTGSTKTCTMSIPYSWSLSTQASDTMTTLYTVSGSSSTTNALPARSSTLSPLDSRKVPSTGTTTALTAAVTL